MAQFEDVNIRDFPGVRPGYSAEQREAFQTFVEALQYPGPAPGDPSGQPEGRLGQIIAPDFRRTDGPVDRPADRFTEVGKGRFLRFRRMVRAGSEPLSTEGEHIPDEWARRMVGGEAAETELPRGFFAVAAGLGVKYRLTGGLFVPERDGPGTVLDDVIGRVYNLQVIERAIFNGDGQVVERWGLFADIPPDGFAAPHAIQAELNARRLRRPWPPRTLRSVILDYAS